MQPKDMSKKRFKLIPGADYENGPISKYGTFGNMLRTRIVQGLKKSADNIPMSAADIDGDYIEGITDFINPISGSMKFIKGISSLKKTKNAAEEYAKDPRFKEGLWDHANDKDRQLFDKNERGYMENISAHLKPMGNEGMQPIFRGMRISPDDELMSLKPGDFFMSDRAMPFSWDKSVAEKFGIPTGPNQPQSIRMVLSDRQSGIDLPKIFGKNNWNESEVMMPANAKFEVLDIEDEIMDYGPRRTLLIGENQTVPEGSRMLNYRDADKTDYTNAEQVKLKIKNLEEKLTKSPYLKESSFKNLRKKQIQNLKNTFEESNRNKPEGTAYTTEVVPGFERVEDFVKYIEDMI